jgi:cell division transport system permease protein
MKFSFLLKETMAGVRANPGMFVSIVLVTLVSMTFVLASALLQTQLQNFKSFWFEKSNVVVYLCSETTSKQQCPLGVVTDEQIQALRTQLQEFKDSGYLVTSRFESQQVAFERLQSSETVGGQVNYISPTQLNSSYWLQLSDPENATLIVEALVGQPGVAEVQDQRSFFDPIVAILNNARISATVVAAVMLASAALLTSTTIRLSAHSRRREIAIKRLVGASLVSIQIPFILEGLLAAFLGTLLSMSTAFFFLDNVDSSGLSDEYALGEVVASSDLLAVAPEMFFIALALAGLASLASTFRNIRS